MTLGLVCGPVIATGIFSLPFNIAIVNVAHYRWPKDSPHMVYEPMNRAVSSVDVFLCYLCYGLITHSLRFKVMYR